jgi:hypothetical protein
LAGALPSEIQQLSALMATLNLPANNKLTGHIPAELGLLEALTEPHLSGTKLAGPIPAELGQLGALTKLQLQGNQLSGPYPLSWRSCRASFTSTCGTTRNQTSSPARRYSAAACKSTVQIASSFS